MKITELLELLGEVRSKDYSFEIFSDGSGSIKDFNNNIFIGWDNERDMEVKLNGLYNSLNKETIKFEL